MAILPNPGCNPYLPNSSLSLLFPLWSCGPHPSTPEPGCSSWSTHLTSLLKATAAPGGDGVGGKGVEEMGGWGHNFFLSLVMWGLAPSNLGLLAGSLANASLSGRQSPIHSSHPEFCPHCSLCLRLPLIPFAWLIPTFLSVPSWTSPPGSFP